MDYLKKYGKIILCVYIERSGYIKYIAEIG